MVSREIDLKQLQNNKVYTFEVGQLLDGRYIAEKVINPDILEEKGENPNE